MRQDRLPPDVEARVRANGNEDERGNPLLAGRVLLAEGIENGIEPPVELVRDVILRGRVHWVYAPAGTAKTWLALWIVKCCMEMGLRVVYFDAENGLRTISERLERLGVPTDRLDDLLYFFPFPYLTTEPGAVDAYKALLDEVRPDVVIFDSLVNFLGSSGLEENSNDDLVKWATVYTRPARKLEIACLILDHTPHDGDHARGASRKKDEADVMWALRSPAPFDRDTVGSVVLRRDKDREAWLPERVGFSVGGTADGFTFRRSDGTIEQPNPENGLTDSERRTLDALRDDFGVEGARAREWLRAAKKRGVSESSFWRAKRAFMSPQKEGLVTVGSDSRFHVGPPPEPDSGESGVSMQDSEELSQLSEHYHGSGDSGTTITTITPPHRGDSSDSADREPVATPRGNHRRLSADEAERVKRLIDAGMSPKGARAEVLGEKA
jgi:hypothetical protein